MLLFGRSLPSQLARRRPSCDADFLGRRHSPKPRKAKLPWGTPAGTTATELALVLPLLILVAVACSDFARVIQVRQVVANAARSGAQRGALQQCTEYSRPDWEQQVRQAVSDELQHLEQYDASTTAISIESNEDLSGGRRVTVEVDLRFDTLVAWPGLPTQVLLHHRAEFPHFR